MKYQAGQIWQYHTRTGEEDSRVIILQVDSLPTGEAAIHIAVRGLQIPIPGSEQGIMGYIGHLPFAEEALAQSLTELESSDGELPDYQEGYNNWKQAFDAGQAGIFTISLAEAVDFVAQSLSGAKPA